MTKIKNKRLLIFDLDGVLFNSKENMKIAWISTSKKFNLNIPFSLYFKNIGMPFLDILRTLNVKPEIKLFKHFQSVSKKNLMQIKPYNRVIEELKLITHKELKFSIVTSKDFKRTKLLLRKYNIKPNSLHCPNNKLRGKPHPDHLLKSLEKNKVKAKDACFLGDTKIDYLAAKRAKVDFVFVKYGYGKYEKSYKNSISNFSEIKKFFKGR